MKKIILFLLLFAMGNVANSQITDYTRPVLGFVLKYVQIKDTVFKFFVYETDEQMDSIVCGDKMTRLSKTKWIGRQNSEGSLFVMKFKKIKNSSWFKKNNGLFFQADYELTPCMVQRFDSDGTIYKRRLIGTFAFVKIIKPQQITPQQRKKRYGYLDRTDFRRQSE